MRGASRSTRWPISRRSRSSASHRWCWRSRTTCPAKTLQEFIAYAKENPGKLNYASSGVGAAAHLTTEDLKRRAGIDLVHVPYRGTGPALTDLMAGNVGVMIDTQLGLKPQIDAGGIRGIAIAGEKRSPTMPDLPTFIESGMPGFVSSTWTLLLAPAKTPPAIVDRLAAEVAKAVKNPVVAAKLTELGVEIVGNSPAEATAFLKDEVAKWGTVIREANVKLEQ
jgi:tripartite-type tricarboxylate transporter receptor subunit TctC